MQQLRVVAPNGLRIRMLPQGDAHVFAAMPLGMTVERLDLEEWNESWLRVRARFSATYVVDGYASKTWLAPITPELAPAPEPPPPGPDAIAAATLAASAAIIAAGPDLGRKQLFNHYSEAETGWPRERWRSFSPKEFACSHCGQYMHDPDFLDALQALRDAWGRPLKVNSGTRCQKKNTATQEASKTSQHMPPNIAADLSIAGLEGDEPIQLLHLARKLGFNGCGRGNTFLHVDRRPAAWSSWWYFEPFSKPTWERFLEAHTARTGRTFIEPDDCPADRRHPNETRPA